MDKKAILAKAIINLSVTDRSNDKINSDLNDFFLEELPVLREKILEQKQNIAATIEQDLSVNSSFYIEVDIEEIFQQLADKDALTLRAWEIVTLNLPTDLY